MKKFLAVAVLSAGLGALCMHAYADQQPHMKNALSSLETALEHLQKASHDKGGHRGKAVGHVKNAIQEVKAGIQFDNKH